MPKCPEWEAYFLDALEAATSCCGMAKAPFCGSIVVPCCTGKANEQHCFLDKSGTRYNTVCKGIYVGVSRRLAVPPEQDAQIVTGETNWQSKGIYIYTYSNDWQQKSLQNHFTKLLGIREDKRGQPSHKLLPCKGSWHIGIPAVYQHLTFMKLC